METPKDAQGCVALLFDDNWATKAVLAFLRNTMAGQMVTMPPQEDAEDGREEAREGGEGEEGEAGEGGPLLDCALLLPFSFPQALCLYFRFCVRSTLFVFLLFSKMEKMGRRKGGPTLTARHRMALRRIAG